MRGVRDDKGNYLNEGTTMERWHWNEHQLGIRDDSGEVVCFMVEGPKCTERSALVAKAPQLASDNQELKDVVSLQGGRIDELTGVLKSLYIAVVTGLPLDPYLKRVRETVDTDSR